MAIPTIIDLSLSTDDETVPPKPPATKPRRSRPSFTEFLELDDDFGDSFSFDTDSGKQLRKRRRVSPPSILPEIEDEGQANIDVKAVGPTAASRESREFRIEGRGQISTIAAKTAVPADPIVSTSSPPFRRACPSFAEPRLVPPSSDSSDLDDLFAATTRPKLPAQTQLSARTEALLAQIANDAKPRKTASTSKRKSAGTKAAPLKSASGAKRSTVESEVSRSNNIVAKASGIDKPSRNHRLTSEERRLKEQGREQAKQQKARDKDAEREMRRLANEQKARQKQIDADINQVNKARTDKNISVPEMIVDMPLSIEGQSVDIQIRELLQHLKVETTTHNSVVPNVIKWRRKATSYYNQHKGHWEPMPMKILCEKHIMCLLPAKDFVTMVSPPDANSDDLDLHVRRMKSTYTDSKLIYMIEGLDSLMRKNKNAQNRAYQAAVINRMSKTGTSEPQATQRGRKKPGIPDGLDDEMVEDALLHLQVMHGCLIHHSASTIETAEWVASFTQHISTIPYKAHRSDADASFCMEVGQVKSGENKDDTYIRMLQEIMRVTPSVAYGIAAEYPSVIALVHGLRKHGRLALEDLRKTANKNGALVEARVGPAISKRIYKIFTETDWTSMDI